MTIHLTQGEIRQAIIAYVKAETGRDVKSEDITISLVPIPRQEGEEVAASVDLPPVRKNTAEDFAASIQRAVGGRK